MKFLKLFACVLLIACFTNFAAAQDLRLPSNLDLKTAEDYANYETEIIDLVNWLEKTPMDEQDDLRSDAYRFLMIWVEGAPNVSIEIHAFVMDISKKNAEFIMLFMAGWTKYELQHQEETDVYSGSQAGLEFVLNIYEKGVDVKKEKLLDQLLAIQKEGKLSNWINDKVVVTNK